MTNITFDLTPGNPTTMPLDDARALLRRVIDAINAAKVKCPTCRCMILPEATCFCCAEDPQDTDPFI